MSKVIIAVICIAFLACSKNKSPRQLAMEVCECFEKNQHVSFPDPETGEAEHECAKMQVKIVKGFKGSVNKERQFKQALNDCVSPMVEKFLKSIGK